MSARLPSLSLLRCFSASARHESFSEAAEELGLTQGAVSRQVRDLEAQIGTPLFRREGRGVRLTEAGRALAGPLLADLDRLQRTLRHAIAAGPSAKVLTIAAPPTFATRWLMPRLKHFRAEQEHVEFVVYSRSDPFDLNEEQVDLAVHFGGWDWPGAQLTPLCPEDLMVVAAPDLLAAHPLRAPTDVLSLPLLHLMSRPHLWDRFSQSIAPGSPPPRGGSQFDQFSLIIAATVSGMGVAILPSYLIQAELGDGRLVCLAPVEAEAGQSYFVARPMGRTSKLATDFTAWLRRQVVQRK